MSLNKIEDWNTNLLNAAVDKMRPPLNMHIICIDITNKCDLKCSNCTRLLVNQEHLWEMSPENFRLACKSLKNYKGTIAIIGGNPCMHSKFAEICEIFVEEIPNKEQRGLWTNNAFKHIDLCVKTFGGFNLNPHNVKRGVSNLKTLYKKTGKVGNLYKGNSHHSPLLTAGKDLFEETEMWEKISECDINKYWSGSIVVNNGKLRAYFCEVAAAFDIANNQDHGVEVTVDWWKRPMQDFTNQVASICPSCGVPASLKGSMDHEEIDQYTKSNEHLVDISSIKKRKVVLVDRDYVQKRIDHDVTEYTKSHLEMKKFFGKIKLRLQKWMI